MLNMIIMWITITIQFSHVSMYSLFMLGSSNLMLDFDILEYSLFMLSSSKFNAWFWHGGFTHYKVEI
jgi:hypothetical protein